MTNTASILTGIAFLLFAVGVFVANNRGLITNEALSRWSSIASVLAFVFAIVVFVLPQIQNQNNTATIEEEKAAVEAVVNLEVKAAIEFDLVTLESIYAPNAEVIAKLGTPDDETDDVVYKGWGNIKKHYIGFQLISKPETMSLVELNIDVVGNKAIASHKGVILNGVYDKDFSVYTLEKRNGRWLITKLEYGYIPDQP